MSVRVSGSVRRVGFVSPHPHNLFVLDVTGNNPLRPCGGEGMKLGLGSEFEGGARGIFLENLEPPNSTWRVVKLNIAIYYVVPNPVWVLVCGCQRHYFSES